MKADRWESRTYDPRCRAAGAPVVVRQVLLLKRRWACLETVAEAAPAAFPPPSPLRRRPREPTSHAAFEERSRTRNGLEASAGIFETGPDNTEALEPAPA